MSSVFRRTAVSAAVVALTIGAAAACGSSSSGGDAATSPSTSPTAAAGANAAAVALIPAAIKSKGTLLVASDAEYAPNEFLDTDGTTVIGMDADLAKALGTSLGMSVTLKNATFDAIIPGLVGGRYDLGMSSFTDTKEREKQVNFVTYFQAGTSFFTKSSGGPTVTGLSSLCGLKVAVETGTTQESDAKAQSKTCMTDGKAGVTVQSYPTQAEANVALSAGRAQVSMADSPVADYQVQQSKGTFKLVGTPYGTAPYGIAIPKASGAMDQAVLTALKGLISDGTYASILKKWGLTSGAITDPVINGAIS